MIDSYPNSSSRRHAGAEMPYDGDDDSLSDSANGTALDPDLESILRNGSFLAFIDGKKMSQVVERLQGEKPGEFDIVEQMAEAICVSLDAVDRKSVV